MTAVAPEPRLSDFYLRLADDPSLLEQYERDPEVALAAAGMTDAQIDAVLDGSERGPLGAGSRAGRRAGAPAARYGAADDDHGAA